MDANKQDLAPSDLVSTHEAAQQIGVPEATIHAWQDLKRIGRIDVDGQRMVTIADIAVSAQHYNNTLKAREYWAEVIAAAGPRQGVEEPLEPSTRVVTDKVRQRVERVHRLVAENSQSTSPDSSV